MPYADPDRRREFNRKWMTAYRAAKPERARASLKRWLVKNPDYRRERYHTDDNTRVRDNLRARLHQALRRSGQGASFIGAVVGCSKPDLIAHLEAQFLPGMSWANYGRKGWELDHIEPCFRFDLTDHDQLLRCFHYSNLRPLWRSDNQRRPRKE